MNTLKQRAKEWIAHIDDAGGPAGCVPATNPSQISSSAELWRELEPYLGKDVPDREVVLLSDVKGVLAAPQPPKLSDERILEIAAKAEAQWNAVADQYNQWGQLGFDEIVILIARAIEREILGGGND